MLDSSTSDRAVSTDQAVGSVPVMELSLRSIDCRDVTYCQSSGRLPPRL